MTNDQLNSAFREAVEYVNQYTKPLPADFLLKLYAYYKIANKNFSDPDSKIPLINAFKANALIQVKDSTREEAMQAYIDLVEGELKKKK